MKKLIIFPFICLIAYVASSQQIQKSVEGRFLLKNATVHTITNGTISGDVMIYDNRIQNVGQNITDANAQVIDCTGQHIYPGFIDSGTKLGLSEIGAISLTRDFNEIGDVNAQMQALTAVNPNSVAIPVTRVNGVTTVLASPSGGIFSGTAALIDLHGYTPDQMYAGFKGVVMNFPRSGKRGRWDRRSDEDVKKDQEKAQKRLKEIWDQAKLHAKIDSTMKSQGQKRAGFNAELDALIPVVNGEMLLLVEVNKKEDILAALKWIKENQVNAVLTGVSEGWRVAEEIAKAGLPVITGPVLDIPNRDSDRYDACYANAGKMLKAGIKVAIKTEETENVRNLPFHAAFAAAYGMGVEEALRAITIIPAEIFGVDKDYGSIEKGKVANLFVSDGDPFETKTKINHVFINGWKIPMESRHTLLHDEFLQRSPGLSK